MYENGTKMNCYNAQLLLYSQVLFRKAAVISHCTVGGNTIDHHKKGKTLPNGHLTPITPLQSK